MKIGFLRSAQVASRRSPELETELNDLSRETLRDITIAVLGVDLLWFFVGGMTWPVELGARIWLSSGVVIVLLGVTLWLIPRRLELARLDLQVSQDGRSGHVEISGAAQGTLVQVSLPHVQKEAQVDSQGCLQVDY